MKSVIFAYIIFPLLLTLSLINSFALGNIIENIDAALSETDDSNPALAEEEYVRIYEEYKDVELYVSLSINHDDLSNLENAFAEIIGAARAGDKESIIIIKSRMNDYLRHIKRLIGINIDSIF